MSKCKQPEEAKSSHDVDHRVLQVKFTFYDNITWIFLNLFLTSPSLDDDDKLDAIGLVQGPPPLLVEVSVAEVPAHRVEKAEVIPGKFLVTC